MTALAYEARGYPKGVTFHSETRVF